MFIKYNWKIRLQFTKEHLLWPGKDGEKSGEIYY